MRSLFERRAGVALRETLETARLLLRDGQQERAEWLLTRLAADEALRALDLGEAMVASAIAAETSSAKLGLPSTRE